MEYECNIARADFAYDEKVKIVKGSYAGKTGKIVEVKLSSYYEGGIEYSVRLSFKDLVIMTPGCCLEKRTSKFLGIF